MWNKVNNTEWYLKGLLIISSVIVLCIIISVIAQGFFNSSINNDWNRISVEKNNLIKDECTSLFNFYQAKTLNFANLTVKNKRLLSYFATQNTKKSYETLLDMEHINEYNVEMYNSRLELFLFNGRQLNPDISELKRALNGDKFSVVKEIGFYTYIIVYVPIYSLTDTSNSNAKSIYDGVLATAILLDIKYNIKNNFFSNLGITQEIYDRHNTNVEFDFKSPANYSFIADSALIKEKDQYSLTNIVGDTIGKIYIPRLDKSSYILKVKEQFSGLLDILVFMLNLTIILIVSHLIRNIKWNILKGLIIVVLLLLSRFLWLAIDFPAQLIDNSGAGIFSPLHYASGFGYGIARSLGDFLITSILVLISCAYIVSLVIDSYKKDSVKNHYLINIAIILFSVIAFIALLQYYGVIIQSLVYDSNFKYFDHSQIFPTEQPELIGVQFAIIALSISLLLILFSCSLIVSKYLAKYIAFNRFLRKYPVILVSGIFILISLIIEILNGPVFELSMQLNYRLLIIALTSIFTFYIHRQLIIKRNYRFNSTLNFSILILACIIFVPVILLNKISSQENKYLELLSRRISEKADDKIISLIMSSIENVSETPNFESDLSNKNKYSKLAFNIWSKSSLYTEDLNTAVFVLDTNKRVISDFNINPSELISDSVVNFAARSFMKNRLSIMEPEEESSEEIIDDAEEEMLQGRVIQNKEMKFYCGIKPIEKANLIRSKYRRLLGYLVIAAQYDAKNYLSQSGMQIFKNFSRDNIINKLTSTPVISEFSDGEMVSSNNKDISRSLNKSLDLFRESVKDKIDKSSFRYDQVENQLYKSFYILSPQKMGKNEIEKIYVVSIKINDFGQTTFFVFKFLIFVVVLYLIFIFIYLSYRVSKYLMYSKYTSTFKFGFREKIFVSFIVVSVIPIIVLAVYSREFVKDKNSEFDRSQMVSDLRIIEQYIKQKNPFPDFSKYSSSGIDYTSLPNIFGKGFSESHKNFNLYIKTRLVSTTNEELYKSDLIDERISGTAFYNIALLKKDYYMENQDVGSLTVVVGYKPIYDNFNNLIGILSSQSVFKQNEINQELTENLVYIFGIYFVAVIFLVIIVNILSYTISNPIIKLQKATEQLSKGNIEIEVKSDSKDEIGELVRSFNVMTKELKRSRAELKRVERESAWRDIARQVAHEIKNPLTPMKLAIQHLFYAYSHGSKDFKSILQTTNRLIIDQIETLNRIATEFSDFAKMPSRNYEVLDIDSILNDVVKLLNSEGKIYLIIDSRNKNNNVIGDKDEVKRAFINIIRNSIQATDEKLCNHKDGHINIETIKNNEYYSITIKDNGVGMDEETLQQLFEPYFSTKSSGMGLGLVITKKIIDDMKGKIFVKSEEKKGTEVEIRFPISAID
ncbi:MAG: HAMP domain-containing protein [Ignavibacteriae bacterium]|nr:MAG: HAMP domain-containing protein [Ignavibacteriota bacterium]